MQPRKRWWIAFVLALFAAAGAATPLAVPAQAVVPAARALPRASYVERVVLLTNEERGRAGLPPLKQNALLEEAAQKHSRAMATADFLDHTDPRTDSGPGDRAQAVGYTWSAIAENIGAGYETPDAVVQGWMDSDEHRRELLSTAYREIGVGYTHESEDTFAGCNDQPCRHYWVQLFGVNPDSYPVIINREALTTTNAQVSLYIYGGEWAGEMRLANDDEPWGPWEPFASTVDWLLPAGEGWHTVRVEMRQGTEVKGASDTIYLVGGGGPVAAPLPESLPPPMDSITVSGELDLQALVDDGEATASFQLLKVDLEDCYGVPEEPVDVFLVFDISGSAGDGPGSNWERTQRFTEQLIDNLSQPIYQGLEHVGHSRVGFIATQTVVTGTIPTRLMGLTDDYTQARGIVAGVHPGGDTDIAGGMRLAAHGLALPSSNGAKAIILMLHDNVAITEKAESVAREVREQGISLYVVANSLNLTETDVINLEQAERLVEPQHFFPDPSPEEIRHLFVNACEGDTKSAARHIRVVVEFSPPWAVEIVDVSRSGKVEDARIVWEIPVVDEEEDEPLEYTVRLTPDALGGTLTYEMRASFVDCNGFAHWEVPWWKQKIHLPGPTIPPATTEEPSGSPSPYLTPTVSGTLEPEPAVTPTPSPGKPPPPTPSRTPLSPLTLCPGDRSSEQTLETSLLPTPVKMDILYLFDVSGSMEGVLAAASRQAGEVTKLFSVPFGDIQFGVAIFSDHAPHPYGDLSSSPFQLIQPLTSEPRSVERALQDLSIEGGGDVPEAYAYALHEATRDPGVGWRTGARHLMVVFGDSVPHDDNLNADIPAPQPVNPGGKWTSGIDPGLLDPGPDGVQGTDDDLDFQTVLDDLGARGYSVLFVVSGSALGPDCPAESLLSYWQEWARRTPGGSAALLGEEEHVSRVVTTLVAHAGSRLQALRLEADPGYRDWFEATPPSVQDISIPEEGLHQTFRVAFLVPEDTAAGEYHFDLSAVGDGAIYATWAVTIAVPADCDGVVAPPGLFIDPCAAWYWWLIPAGLALLVLGLWLLTQWLRWRREEGVAPWWRRKFRQGWLCWLPCLLALLSTLVMAWLLGNALAGYFCGSVAVPPQAQVCQERGHSGSNGSQRVASLVIGGPFVEGPTPLSVEELTREKLAEFDTLVLSQVCKAGSLPPTTLAALNEWVLCGGKLIIYDSDECGDPVDYGWLPYSFETSNPGARGSSEGEFRIIAEDCMISPDPSSPVYVSEAGIDAAEIGDANVMTTKDRRWCGDAEAVNLFGQRGIVHAYSRYGSGLIIYNGLDTDDILEPTMNRLWQQELALPWGDSTDLERCLPCQYRVAGAVSFALPLPWWSLLPIPVLWFLCWYLCWRERQRRDGGPPDDRALFVGVPPAKSPGSPREPAQMLARWRPPFLWNPGAALVLGLGGAGRWVLTHLKKNLLDAGAGTWPEQVRLLLLDTAESEHVSWEEQSQTQVVEFSGVRLEGGEQFTIAEDLYDLVQRMGQDVDCEPEMSGWFPAREYKDTLPPGEMDAALGTRGRRPLGRAALFRHIQREGIRSPLYEKLVAALREVRSPIEEGKFRAHVILVSALGGGFGSAILCDLAYLIRRAAKDAGVEATVFLEAYLVGPAAFRSTHAPQQRMQVNSFATLREVGRFLLSHGRPYPLFYRLHPVEGDQVLHSYCDFSLLDSVYVADTAPFLAGERPENGIFPGIADAITLMLDQVSRDSRFVLERFRQTARSASVTVQNMRGEAIFGTVGTFAYRLPFMDIAEALQVRFARQLLEFYLVGPDLAGQSADPFDPQLNREAEYPPYEQALQILSWTAYPRRHWIELGLLTREYWERYPAGGVPTIWEWVYASQGASRETLGRIGVPRWVEGGQRDLRTSRRCVKEILERFGSSGIEGYVGGGEHALRHFLAPMMGYVLNGRPGSEASRARCGKVGYAVAVLGQMVEMLRGAGAHLREVAAGLPIEQRRQAEPLARSFEALAEVPRKMQASLEKSGEFLVQHVQGHLRNRERVLAEGRARLTEIKVRAYVQSDELINRFYSDYLASQVSNHLDRFYWQVVEQDGHSTLRLTLRTWEDLALPADPNRLPFFSRGLEDVGVALLQPLWQRKDRLLNEVLQDRELNADYLEETADTMTRRGVQLAEYQARLARTTPEDKEHVYQPLVLLHGNATIEGAEQLQEQVQNRLEGPRCGRLETSDPFTLGLLRLTEVVPQSALVLYHDCGRAYRRAFGVERGAGTGVLREPVHVFAAERHALRYEQRLKDIELIPWSFNPLFVAGLEYPQRARIFALAVLAGYLRQDREGSDLYIYRLVLEKEGVNVHLAVPRDAENPEAQLVVAMRTFVLGRPGDDPAHRRLDLDQLAEAVERELDRDVGLLARRLKALEDTDFVSEEYARQDAILEALPRFLREEAEQPGGPEMMAFVRLVAQDAYPKTCELWAMRLREECEDLWAEGSSRSTGEAQAKVAELEQVLPHLPAVRDLKEEAESRHKEAGRREGTWREALRQARFGDLIGDVAEARRQGRKWMPRWIPVLDAQGGLTVDRTEAGELIRLEDGPPGWVEAGTAVEELSVWASQYAGQRAEENLRRARDVLGSDPSQAQRVVDEVLALNLLSERWVNSLKEFAEIEVRPALERRARAEDLRDQGLREGEVVAGWRLLNEAEEIDPYLPRLAQSRAQLRPRLVRHVQRALEQAEMFRAARQGEEARKVLMETWEMTRADPELREWSDQVEQRLQQLQ